MEMLKGVLIAFDVILMMVFWGYALYVGPKQKDISTSISSGVVGAVIASNIAFIAFV